LASFHSRDTAPLFPATETSTYLPKQIGPYHIESVLEKGGMSHIYLGRKDPHSPLTTIKVLQEEYLHFDDMVRRFLKEASLISQASHPNIIQLFGQGKWEKGLYIAMEFVQGISLKQFIEQRTLSKKRAIEIVLQVAYALSHLHSHGIIHRDLKPENILITEDGHIKVIDFGIAQLMGDTQKTITMQRSGLMGTPLYMSPEQLADPPQVNFSSDLYALGLIAYELLLGRLSHGVVQIALLPKKLRPIIERALDFDPKKRYQMADEFIEDLASASQDGPFFEETDFVTEEVRLTWDTLYSDLPPWPQIQWGRTKKEQTLFYLDFLHLDDRRHLVVFAEPVSIQKGTLFSLVGLRSCIQLALRKAKLADGAEEINKTLLKDPHGQNFSFFFLLLSCKKNQLDFISSENYRLFRIPHESENIRTLCCSNPSLGAKDTPFSFSSDRWDAGDQIAIVGKNITQEQVKEARYYAPPSMSSHLIGDSSFSLSLQRVF